MIEGIIDAFQLARPGRLSRMMHAASECFRTPPCPHCKTSQNDIVSTEHPNIGAVKAAKAWRNEAKENQL